MGLVRTWSRQVVRAAGASLIAPLVLLLAAGVVASGGGLGGLGSLGQIASGPSLPDTGLSTASRSSIESAEIVGPDIPRARTEPPSAPAAGPPAGELASATPPGVDAPSARPPVRAELRSRTERSTEPTPTTGAGVLLDDPARGRPPGGPDDLQDATQGLGEALSEPLRPVTDQLLDLLRLLVPPPR